jgi:hypothetical protein
MSKRHQLHLFLDAALADELREVARSEERSVAGVVRTLIKQHLRKKAA